MKGDPIEAGDLWIWEPKNMPSELFIVLGRVPDSSARYYVTYWLGNRARAGRRMTQSFAYFEGYAHIRRLS